MKFVVLVVTTVLTILPKTCLSSQPETCTIGINEVSMFDSSKHPGFLEFRLFSCQSLQHFKVLLIELFHENSRKISFVADLRNVEPVDLLVIGPPSMPEADLKYDDDAVAYWKKFAYGPKSTNIEMYRNVLSDAASEGPIAVAVVYDPKGVVIYNRENSRKTNNKLVVDNDLLQFLMKKSSIVHLLVMDGNTVLPITNVTEVIAKGIKSKAKRGVEL